MLAALRAFVVTFGGAFVVDVAAGASIARLLRRGRRASAWAKAGTALTLGYATVGRRWMAARHEIEIEAPAEDVWPWVAQMGQDRGGFYSIELLENLAGCRMHNADRIHPEWQHREVGELVYLHPLRGLAVTSFEPGRAIELEGWGAFEIDPIGAERCRLAVRSPPAHGPRWLFYALLLEIPHYVMERRMLVGIKRRAEAASRAAAQAPPRLPPAPREPLSLSSRQR